MIYRTRAVQTWGSTASVHTEAPLMATPIRIRESLSARKGRAVGNGDPVGAQGKGINCWKLGWFYGLEPSKIDGYRQKLMINGNMHMNVTSNWLLIGICIWISPANDDWWESLGKCCGGKNGDIVMRQSMFCLFNGDTFTFWEWAQVVRCSMADWMEIVWG